MAARRDHPWGTTRDGAGRFCPVWGLQGLAPCGKAGLWGQGQTGPNGAKWGLTSQLDHGVEQGPSLWSIRRMGPLAAGGGESLNVLGGQQRVWAPVRPGWDPRPDPRCALCGFRKSLPLSEPRDPDCPRGTPPPAFML